MELILISEKSIALYSLYLNKQLFYSYIKKKNSGHEWFNVLNSL